MNPTSEAYRRHLEELEFLAIEGDEFAIKTLACITLLLEGWRYGDPDPDDGDDGPGGGEVIYLDQWRAAA